MSEEQSYEVVVVQADLVTSVVMDGGNQGPPGPGFNEPSQTGIFVRTGANAFTAVSITTSGSGLSITNGSGVSGNPTISLNSELQTLSGLTSTAFGRGFLSLANAAAGRTYIDVDAAGTAASLIAAHEAAADPHSQYLTSTEGNAAYASLAGSYANPSWITSLAWSKITSTPTTLSGYGITDAQPLDSDLTAIAALTTTTYGRSLLTLSDASAGRTSLGLVIGTDVQAYDSDLASIAALTTTAYGRSFLTLADASAARTLIGAGTISTQDSNSVAITGGTINGTTIGATTATTGAFTTISATGQITSTVATGSAPFVVASTTAVANLNASLLLGSTWAAPGTIGSSTPNTGAFSTLNVTNANAALSNLTVFNSTYSVRAILSCSVGVTGSASLYTETNHPLRFGVNNTGYWNLDASGHFVPLSNDANDLGTSSAVIRTAYIGILTCPTFTVSTNAIEQRNGTSAQTFRIYNTTDSGTANYERGFVRWTGNQFQVGVESGGTGSARDINLVATGASSVYLSTSNTTRWQLNSSGHLLAVADNSYDIGASGATRPRRIYVGTDFVGAIGATSASTGAFTTVTASSTVAANGNSTHATDGFLSTNSNNGFYFTLQQMGATGYGVSNWANSSVFEAVGGDMVLDAFSSGKAVIFQQARAKIAEVNSTSIDLVSGIVLKVNSTQVVTARKTGWGTATGTATRTTFDTTTVTTQQLAERVKALIDDLHGTAGHGLIGT